MKASGTSIAVGQQPSTKKLRLHRDARKVLIGVAITVTSAVIIGGATIVLRNTVGTDENATTWLVQSPSANITYSYQADVSTWREHLLQPKGKFSNSILKLNLQCDSRVAPTDVTVRIRVSEGSWIAGFACDPAFEFQDERGDFRHASKDPEYLAKGTWQMTLRLDCMPREMYFPITLEIATDLARAGSRDVEVLVSDRQNLLTSVMAKPEKSSNN